MSRIKITSVKHESKNGTFYKFRADLTDRMLDLTGLTDEQQKLAAAMDAKHVGFDNVELTIVEGTTVVKRATKDTPAIPATEDSPALPATSEEVSTKDGRPVYVVAGYKLDLSAAKPFTTRLMADVSGIDSALALLG